MQNQPNLTSFSSSIRSGAAKLKEEKKEEAKGKNTSSAATKRRRRIPERLQLCTARHCGARTRACAQPARTAGTALAGAIGIVTSARCMP